MVCRTCKLVEGVCGNPRRRLCELCYFAELRLRAISRIDKSKGLGPNGTCHVWKRCKRSSSYGTWYVLTPTLKEYKAHRVVWILKHGPIPDALFVLHKCDNPSCVRLSHLYLGTNADRAVRERGYNALGEDHKNHVLTVTDVKAIRATTGVTLKVLATKYRVSTTTISRIIHKQMWQHVA